MSDRATEQVDEACVIVRERIAALDAELADTAADCLVSVATQADYRRGFSGAIRRVLSDRIIERIALEHLLAARDEALERVRDSRRRQAEYQERVVKPRRAEEEKQQRLRAESEARDAHVRGALNRVRATINRVEKPDPADVEILRCNASYQDRYCLPGAIDQLLLRHDRVPWWRAT